MKTTLIIGSFLAVFLMIMPTIGIVESKQVQIIQTIPSLLKSQDTVIQVTQENFKQDPQPQPFLLLKLMIWFLKFIASLPVKVLYIYLLLLILF
ncbi:hypothetical protein AYK25_01785 [Thermoplasmatales archaeon SM1-50]|nr:MAG: hypothetical protein AYK25_01785 [Thermoplasmatales archaeon SM1-50]